MCRLPVGWAVLAFGARIWLGKGQHVILKIFFALGCPCLVFSLSGVEWLGAGLQSVVQFCTKVQQLLFSAPGARFRVKLGQCSPVLLLVVVAWSFPV